MQRSRLERVLDALANEPSVSLPARVCSAATGMLSSPGAGIAVITDHGHHRTVCAVGPGSTGEELQLTLGEGPTYESYRRGQPVLIDDLADDDRWPVLSRGAEEAGIRAIFAFPMQSGAAQLGAFTLYRDRPGPLDDGQYLDALVFARVALDLLLTADEKPPSGDLTGANTAQEPDTWEIHQATGMISVQLEVSLRDAMAILRGHAFSSGRSIGETAGDVVAGRLQLGGGR